jgi:hypothetical protein
MAQMKEFAHGTYGIHRNINHHQVQQYLPMNTDDPLIISDPSVMISGSSFRSIHARQFFPNFSIHVFGG